MNSRSRVRMLHEESTIEINKVFAKMAENPFSEEYAALQNLRKDYPVYKVRTREINKNPNKESWKGLTYAYMEDYIRQLDAVLTSGNRPLLEGAGSVSHTQAIEKARTEYRKYQANTLSPVERAYLDTIKVTAKNIKRQRRGKDKNNE